MKERRNFPELRSIVRGLKVYPHAEGQTCGWFQLACVLVSQQKLLGHPASTVSRPGDLERLDGGSLEYIMPLPAPFKPLRRQAIRQGLSACPSNFLLLTLAWMITPTIMRSFTQTLSILLVYLVVPSFVVSFPHHPPNRIFYDIGNQIADRFTMIDAAQFNFAPFKVTNLRILCTRLDPTVDYSCNLTCKRERERNTLFPPSPLPPYQPKTKTTQITSRTREH